jgi:hypothetical protein
MHRCLLLEETLGGTESTDCPRKRTWGLGSGQDESLDSLVNIEP